MFPTKCDYMNVTGCDQLHSYISNGTGIKHFIYIHAVELGLLLGFIGIIFLCIYLLKYKK